MQKIRERMLLVASLGLLTFSALAQVPPGLGSGITLSARKEMLRANGARLEGDAHVKSPQLDVAADTIAFDGTQNQISEIRARGHVLIKVNLAPAGNAAATHIEASCAWATLTPATRTLLLEGNVDGYFQPADGARNSLSGKRATLHYGTDKSVLADVEGGPGGVRLVLPAENSAQPTALGSIVITAQRLNLNTTDGSAHMAGNAHAVSTDGPNRFDVSAPQFVLARGNSGTLDTLTTSGRTLLKIDMPSEKVGVGTAGAGVTATATSGHIGKPTHLEVSADSATVQRATNTVVFDGHVSGFYELSRPGTETTRQPFSGDRAVVKYILPDQATADNPAGFQFDMNGPPAVIAMPGVNLNL